MFWCNSEVTEVEGSNKLSSAHKDSYDSWLEHCSFVSVFLHRVYVTRLYIACLSQDGESYNHMVFREPGRRTRSLGQQKAME